MSYGPHQKKSMSTAAIPPVLPPDLQQFVLDQLAAGKYQSASYVVWDAVRLVRERELRLAFRMVIT